MSPCPLLQQAVDEKNTIIRYRKAKEHEAQVGTSPISVSRDVRDGYITKEIQGAIAILVGFKHFQNKEKILQSVQFLKEILVNSQHNILPLF